MTHTEQTPAEHLAAIIAAGCAAFESALPVYAQRQSADVDAPEMRTHLAVSEARQIELCLNCPLSDCAGVASEQCPIRIESRREWKRRRELASVAH